MFLQRFLCDKPLRPLKGCSVLVGDLGIGVNGLADLARMGEALRPEGEPRQEAEPDFDLVQPGCVRGRVVEMDVPVPSEPAIMFGFMGVEVVENDMKLAVRKSPGDAVHEIEKLDAAAAF